MFAKFQGKNGQDPLTAVSGGTYGVAGAMAPAAMPMTAMPAQYWRVYQTPQGLPRVAGYRPRVAMCTCHLGSQSFRDCPTCRVSCVVDTLAWVDGMIQHGLLYLAG